MHDLHFSSSSYVGPVLIDIPKELYGAVDSIQRVRVLAFKIGSLYFGEIVNEN